jgi:hypothetical protein
MATDQAKLRIAELVSTAKRLRTTRIACRQFLALWAMQRGAAFADRDRNDEELADPMNHDWSILYRGSVLDD